MNASITRSTCSVSVGHFRLFQFIQCKQTLTVGLVACVQCGVADGSQHEKQLYQQLLRGYMRHVRPVKRDSDPVRVRVALSACPLL